MPRKATKSKIVLIRFTPAEWKQIKKEAKMRAMAMSAVIRDYMDTPKTFPGGY